MAQQKWWLLVAMLISVAMFAGFLLSAGPNQVLALASSTTAPLSYGFATQGLHPDESWLTGGAQVEEYLGYSVAIAGDINNDGFADILIGAYAYDVVSGTDVLTNAGKAELYVGSEYGFEDTPDWTVLGDQAYGSLGVSVARAGDVNDDGYDDVVVSAHGYDVAGVGANAGRVYVFAGSEQGLSDTPAVTLDGSLAGGYFGFNASTAGNVNDDAYDDVIVSAPYYVNGAERRGRAWVYLGSAAGLNTTHHWTAYSDAFSNYFGHSVGTAGDVNDDGYDDIAVGAIQYGNAYGAVFVWHGSETGLVAGDTTAATADWRAVSNHWGYDLGYAVSTAGDVNNDGYDDLIASARRYGGTYGAVYGWYGSAAGLHGGVQGGTSTSGYDWIATGAATQVFGYAVSEAGDVNGDGFGDILVGAYGDEGSTTADSTRGYAYLYRGTADGLEATAAWSDQGDAVDTRFGRALDGGGDTNADGYDDALVGAPRRGSDAAGAAYVYLGWACRAQIEGTPTLYTDLQSAVDAASPGATIQASGYCPGVSARGGLTQTLYVSKSLTIRGDLLPDFTPPVSNTDMVRTVLDARDSGRAVAILGSPELITVTLEGLHLTHGDAAGLGYGEPDTGGTPTDGAGGLLVEDASVTLRNCDVTDNTAEGGGGIGAVHTNLTLTDTYVYNNGATNGDGGGIATYQATLTVVDSSLESNWASEYGGALDSVQTHALISDTKIIRNNAMAGAGVHFDGDGDYTVQSSQVLWNTAAVAGGGLHLEEGHPKIVNSFIGDNTAPDGSGVFVRNADPALVHNSIVVNDGGAAVHAVSDDGFAHTTAITNALIVSNTTALYAGVQNTIAVNGVLWFGNTAKTGGAGDFDLQHEVTGEPNLRNAGDGDYWLLPYSPAINQGVVSTISADIIGNPRPTGQGYDLGAHELVIDPAISGVTAHDDGPTTMGDPTTLTATATSPVTVTFAWSFGDSTSGSGSSVQHTYPSAGVYVAQVNATDSVNVATASTTVVVVDVATVGGGDTFTTTDNVLSTTLPSGTPSVVITYTPQLPVPVPGFPYPPQPPRFGLDASLLGSAYNTFSPPLLVTVAYPSNGWSSLALTAQEDRLALYAWDAGTGSWLELPTVTRDTIANTLTAEVATTGTSYMLAVREHRIFLPLVLR